MKTEAIGTATYSPDDNKLRIYPFTRVDEDIYAKIKAAGYKWAPHQKLFVAPTWTPNRADIAEELCHDIGDEDTTLVERAEERSERFEGYSANREQDASQAHNRVQSLCDQIQGQPILVGHHSEKRSRRDQAKIQDGTSKAVKLWDTANYWTHRAAGALRAAKHHERPDVRARRIKKLEAAKRKEEKMLQDTDYTAHLWETIDGDTTICQKDGEPLTPHERALHITNFYDRGSYCFPLSEYPRPPEISQYEGSMSLWSAIKGGIIPPEKAQSLALATHAIWRPHYVRWIAHYEHRLAYERAMLTEQGGTVTDRKGPELGGAIKSWVRRGQWCEIVKVNKVTVVVMDNWGHGGPDFLRKIVLTDAKDVLTKAEFKAINAGEPHDDHTATAS